MNFSTIFLRVIMASMLIASSSLSAEIIPSTDSLIPNIKKRFINSEDKEIKEELWPYTDVNSSDLAALLVTEARDCLLYTSPSPRDMRRSRMPSSA